MPQRRQLGWYREATLRPYMEAARFFFVFVSVFDVVFYLEKESYHYYGTHKVRRKPAAGDVPQLL